MTVSGVAYNGTGYFKFAVVNQAGDESYWSNDGTSHDGSEPDTAVALTIANSLFNVLLGDTSLVGMSQPLTASVFSEPDRYLRVWFSSDASTYSQLNPDRRIASVPYALQAEEASRAQDSTLFNSLPSSYYAPDVPYYPMLQVQTVDLTEASSYLKGFYGGFTDGHYGYFVPFNNNQASGYVARLDLQNFSSAFVTYINLNDTIPGSRGYTGGFTDGRYGYFVPYYNGVEYHGRLARVDLQYFIYPGNVTILNLNDPDTDLQGFWGGFTDGRYGYLMPCFNGTTFSGKFVRIDLQNFTLDGVTVLDLGNINAAYRGFVGGFTDGHFGYLVPYTYGTFSGVVVRVDLQNFSPSGVRSLDLTLKDPGMRGYSGGFTDGRYAYFVPRDNEIATHGKIARVDLNNFTSPEGVTMLDLETVNPGLTGFSGGFTDGRYGYFVPFFDMPGGMSGMAARVDLRDFSPSGVSFVDLAAYDSSLKGFFGGFSDGRFGYFVPYYNAGYVGKVARIPLFNGAGTP